MGSESDVVGDPAADTAAIQVHIPLAEVRNQKLAPSVRKEVIEIYCTVIGVDFS